MTAAVISASSPLALRLRDALAVTVLGGLLALPFIGLVTVEEGSVGGFGSFVLRDKGERVGRNPKTGDAVALAGKHVPHFKPGKELREQLLDHR